MTAPARSCSASALPDQRTCILFNAPTSQADGAGVSLFDRFLATCDARALHVYADIDEFLNLLSQRGAVFTAVQCSAQTDRQRYLFPRHPGEIYRLDVQHYALRETLRANLLSPVEDPRRVLDVGCGTGQWAFEICEEFPEVLVVGLDLVTGKP